MLDEPQAISTPETESIDPPSPSEGYTISLQVLPDGTFLVDEESAPNIETAVKHILAIIAEHPSDETAQAGFEAGYQTS